ncbi:MAG: TOBE domain-containing protein, partial [Lachnospiraceae bacterium]|nr:TOBE domain-containing protein [Lachnospiraceae bacterium]
YNYPCNMFVAGFIGSPQMNFVTVKVEKEGDGVALVFGTSRIPLKKPELEAYIGKEVVMGIRPEDIHAEANYLSACEAANIHAHVNLAEMMGSEIYAYLNAYGQKMIARIPSRIDMKADQDVVLAVDREKIHVFDKETQKVICH